MSSHVAKQQSQREAPKALFSNKIGGIEISTLAKWIILLIFLLLIIIILVKFRGAGEDNISSLCERTGGLMGC